MKKILLALTTTLLTITLVSCNLLNINKTKYRITFYNEEEIYLQYEVYENSSLEEPEEPNKEGYKFIGWYLNLEDETTKWDFKNEVTGHKNLYAKWELKEQFINVTNIKIFENKLTWDKIEDAIYEIKFNNETFNTSDNTFTLNEQLFLEQQEIEITPIKKDFTGLTEKIIVLYKQSEIIDSYTLDFEAFDFSDFKELNRSSFKSSEINYDDHYLFVNEGRLTKVDEEPKTGAVALILRQDGFIEFKEGITNFEQLSFNLGSYKNNNTNSSLSILVKNADLEYQLINTFNVTKENFENIIITKENISNLVNLNEKIFFKFVINKNSTAAKDNLIIDDIVFYEKTQPYFQILNHNSKPLSEYYAQASNLTGKELVEELRIIISTNLNSIRYQDIKTILEFADKSLEDETKVIGIYDRRLLKANWGTKSEWHREHVWPNSRLGMPSVKESEVNQGSDPHNLRAIYPSTNSSRSNRYFDNSQINVLGHTILSDRYYPGDEDKGDVARILMYMAVRYDFLGLTNHVELLNQKAYTKEAAYMGLLDVLLDWHLEDPVDDFERQRNEVIYQYQNNRNPFIDHPELFMEVYTYLLSVDNKRIVKNLIITNYDIDYSLFKRNNNYKVA